MNSPINTVTVVAKPRQKPLRQKVSKDDRNMGIGLVVACLGLFLTLVLPLYTMLAKSLEDRTGEFIGMANFIEYFSTPSLANSIGNSLMVSVLATVITILTAFMYAYGLNRTCMRWKGFFKIVSVLPLLAPSLLPAISLVYFFGNQGIIKEWLFGHSVYGAIGIVMSLCLWVFPPALMIIKTSLETTDARLYEAALAMKAKPSRIFFTITLPNVQYGLISAVFVVFTLTVTDFGAAMVIGGQFGVLATDLYKQVIGQQNFQMGAVVGLVLLLPAILAFVVDRQVQSKQISMFNASSVPYIPKPKVLRDNIYFVYCLLVALMLIGVLAMAIYASLVTFWPYNLELSLLNYQFDLMDGGGWGAYRNSLQLALYTAVFGTCFVFLTAYLVEKSKVLPVVRNVIQMLTLLPMAVPGMVLGLSYIFFFNSPNNPLNFLYGSMAILVICTIVHFYTVSHLTAVTALKQMDPEIESISASLKVPVHRTFWKVTVPMCLPAGLDISTYLFTTAMTTISAVIFLYSPSTKLASVAVLNMEGAGDIAPAAAMAVVIVLTSGTVRIAHWFITRRMRSKVLYWRQSD